MSRKFPRKDNKIHIIWWIWNYSVYRTEGNRVVRVGKWGERAKNKDKKHVITNYINKCHSYAILQFFILLKMPFLICAKQTKVILQMTAYVHYKENKVYSSGKMRNFGELLAIRIKFSYFIYGCGKTGNKRLTRFS